MTETLDRISLIFQYQDENNFVFSNLNPDVTNAQLSTFGLAFNSLQRNVAHTFLREERFVLGM